MTRKEAFNNRPMLQSITEANLIDKFISKIYDDFESRTCENCKYWRYSDENVYFEDCNFGLIGHSYNPNSFGCNRWEPKDE